MEPGQREVGGDLPAGVEDLSAVLVQVAGAAGGVSEKIDFRGGWLNVNQQIRFVGNTMVFAPPKGNKVRSVPLSPRTAVALKTHMKSFPSTEVTLPWETEDGKPRTLRLLFTDAKGKAYNRSVFNQGDWKRALVHAGVIPPRTSGSQYFEAAPDDGMHALRHTYASAQLEGGTNIKALSVFLGHSDPGFTLRTYTHLMPAARVAAAPRRTASWSARATPSRACPVCPLQPCALNVPWRPDRASGSPRHQHVEATKAGSPSTPVILRDLLR